MDVPTSAFYSKNAEGLASQYRDAGVEYEERLLHAFGKARKILDVGCGTGRDVCFLLRKGKDAYGLDSSKEMLLAAKAMLVTQGLSGEGRLFEDKLPDSGRFGEGEFDGVLCSAVLMHLPDEELFDAVYALRRVLKPSGVPLVSVPTKRMDVDPLTRRDAHGRFFSDMSPAKLRLLFERIAFAVREPCSVSDGE